MAKSYREAKSGSLKDYNPIPVNPLRKQFEPTESMPIRQHAQMAGDPCGMGGGMGPRQPTKRIQRSRPQTRGGY